MREFVLGDRGGESPLSISENINQNKQENKEIKSKKKNVSKNDWASPLAKCLHSIRFTRDWASTRLLCNVNSLAFYHSLIDRSYDSYKTKSCPIKLVVNILQVWKSNNKKISFKRPRISSRNSKTKPMEI